MNKRWITLLGRLGTVLIVIGLALALLSLVPPQKVLGSDFMGSPIIQSETFLTPFYSSEVLTPQRSLQVTIEANNSVMAYLLKVGKDYLYSWIRDNLPDDSQNESYMFNVSMLEVFLNAHSNSVAWQGGTAYGQVEFEYVPTRIVNATLVLSNSGSEPVRVDYGGKKLNLIAPKERILTSAELTIPLGIVIAIPWLNSVWRGRRKIK
ncbi:MAG: hypothetical protein OEZ25_08380 [Candidatus Bathyarchaeota archaeon]|nr:hypothetical protein [Candidatus Bathyarchaeota archaeon]